MSETSRTPRALAGALAAGALLALSAPGASAASTTYRATIVDPARDAADGVDGGRDIRKVRVDYRSDGRITVDARMLAAPSITEGDMTLTVLLQKRVKGKCGAPMLSVGGLLSEPGLGVGFTMSSSKGKAKLGTYRYGTAKISGTRWKLAVKHKSFRKQRPGCLYVALSDTTDPTAVFDDTQKVARFKKKR